MRRPARPSHKSAAPAYPAWAWPQAMPHPWPCSLPDRTGRNPTNTRYSCVRDLSVQAPQISLESDQYAGYWFGHAPISHVPADGGDLRIGVFSGGGDREGYQGVAV